VTRKITQTLLLTPCFIILFSCLANAGVQNSKHDFSKSTGGSNLSGVYRMTEISGGTDLGYIDEVCVFCHTPHGASTNVLYAQDGVGTPGFLWNRVLPKGAANGYKLYSSSTLTLIPANNNPTGISLMCLSCHDGVTSIAVGRADNGTNVLLELPATGSVMVDTSWDPGANTKIGEIYNGNALLGGWGPNIGNLTALGNPIDLSNDHPVSFKTDVMASMPGMKAGWPTDPGLRLFGSHKSMECSTCHNVHDNTTYPPFLAVSNDQSKMCLACHDK